MTKEIDRHRETQRQKERKKRREEQRTSVPQQHSSVVCSELLKPKDELNI